MSAGLLATLADDPAFRRQRRDQLIAGPHLTGVDWVEVTEADAGRLQLKLHFVPSDNPARAAIPTGIGPGNILVTVPALGTAMRVVVVHHPRDRGTVLVVDLAAETDELSGAGRSAILEVVGMASIDPLFARAGFTLAKEEVAALDPLPSAYRTEAPPPSRGIDYLAKDFQSFRRLMLDHMAARVPEWSERHPADIGIVVVEALAYAADYLSYFQDAVATEAYLNTARRRISVRRHARLLDYRTYENCAARVWLQINVRTDGRLQRGFRAFCDRPGPFPDRLHSIRAGSLARTGQAVFETVEDVDLSVRHNCLPLYDWGLGNFHVPAGATSAMLAGAVPDLRQGQILMFAPRLGPDAESLTGPHAQPGHAVRLTRTGRVTSDPLSGHAITEITWAEADALPFALVLTTTAGSDDDSRHGFVACGNVVAADAGVTVLPKDRRGYELDQLRFQDVVYSVPYDRQRGEPAADFLQFAAQNAVPTIALETIAGESSQSEAWNERADLLDSDRFACDYVAETDDFGVTTLRFGDGRHGRRCAPGTRFRAIYRAGSGSNQVGAYAIRSWEPRPQDDFVDAVTNPLPAGGGSSRQPLREVRREAPDAFRDLRHCAVEQDFVAVVKAHAAVRAAVAQTRWSGSRHTIRLYVQRAGHDADAAFLAGLAADLERRRILGTDVALYPPHYVPLQISLTIAVHPAYPANAVRRAVADATEALYRDGRLSFGEPVFLSPLIACARDVAGVQEVRVDAFHRFGRQPRGEIEAGRIQLGPTEIARLDNRAGAVGGGRLIVVAAAGRP